MLASAQFRLTIAADSAHALPKIEEALEKAWEALSLLESEGNYDRMNRSFTRILEERYAAGLITQGAYDQALGKAADA